MLRKRVTFINRISEMKNITRTKSADKWKKINTCTRFILDIIHVSLLCDFLHGDTKPYAKDQMTFL